MTTILFCIIGIKLNMNEWYWVIVLFRAIISTIVKLYFLDEALPTIYDLSEEVTKNNKEGAVQDDRPR